MIDRNLILKAKGISLHNDDFEIPDDKIVERQSMSELEKVIYSINPKTGLPDNDLKVMNDINVSPELRKAIQNRNHVMNPVGASSFDDDAVLDNAQQPYESTEQFHERLKEEYDNMQESRESEGD